MMKKKIVSHIALLFVSAASSLFAQDRLFYEQPAVPGAQALENNIDKRYKAKGNPKGNVEQQYLLEALPLGNGRLGAMFSGGIDKEILVINDITLWANAHRGLDEVRQSGTPIGAGVHLEEVRKVYRDSDFHKMANTAEKYFFRKRLSWATTRRLVRCSSALAMMRGR